MTLRLASYNVHKCVGTDGKRLPGRVIDAINEIGADVVALQEVDRRLGPRPAALPPELILKATDFTPLPRPGNGPSLGWNGQTILVRSTVEIAHVEAFDLPGLEPRGAVLAELLLDAGPLRVIAVHLGLVRRHRQMQMRALRDAIAARGFMPTAILGDFNEWSPTGGMEPLADAFHVHAPGLSFHASRPIAALDRIALSRGLHLHDAGVTRSPAARLASDHLPVWADVRIDG